MAYEINRRIKYYRIKKGLSQNKVADALDMNISSYSQCERKGQITAERLIKIAEVLEIDIMYLLTDMEDTTAIAKPLPQPEPENPYDLTKKEKKFIEKLRSLPKDAQDEYIQFVQEMFDNKTKNRKNRTANTKG